MAFVPATRTNLALTASIEKRALQWMSSRMPRWITSDKLTALGLCAQIGAGICSALLRYHRYALLLVVIFIVLNWFGDSIDGTLARVRCQQRPRYGFYVDHMVDIFGSVAMMGGLRFFGYVHWQTAIAMLTAILLLASEIPMAIIGYSRLFVTGHAFDYGLALALPRSRKQRDDGKSLRIELRDYWTFANPSQHNVMLRIGWMVAETD